MSRSGDSISCSSSQVVAFDEDIAGGFPMFALFRPWAQGAGAGDEDQLPDVALAEPVETVLLGTVRV